MRIDVPSLRSASISAHSSWRICGSSPTVGSSSSSRRGRCTSARAISSRRRIPPESLSTGVSARSTRFAICSARSTAPRRSGRGTRYSRANTARFWRAVSSTSRLSSCGTTPHSARARLESAGTSNPSTWSSPASGIACAVSIFIVVDLPAPFGPSRPTHVPSGTSRSSPSTAVMSPKRFVTPRRRIARGADIGESLSMPDRAAVVSLRRMRPELVGREPELRSVERFLDAVPAGARALVIDGEAGAGKTSVWLAAIGSAQERGFRVLTARPVEAETGFGFASLGDLLRDSIGEARRLPGRQSRALEIALLLTEGDEEPVDRHAVSLALLGVLRLVCERGAVVLALDDAQWLDGPSAAVMRFAFRRLGDLPAGVVVTVRGPPGAPAPLGLEPAFAREQRLVRLPLTPLGADAIRRLLAARLGLRPPRPTLERLHALSGGNPFFALELGRAFMAGTVRFESGEPLPVTLDRLVRDRLDALAPTARAAVLAAAATARPTVAIVGAAIGGDSGALAEAERASIVELDGDRIRFVHPLLASGTYAAADGAVRRELHARLSRLVADT